MPGGGDIGAIFLFDDEDVDGASEGGRIDLIVEALEVGQQLAHIIHLAAWWLATGTMLIH